MVFNDTRVIRARLPFVKPTGGAIEIFCLDPLDPPETEAAFGCAGRSVWKCLVGNSKKWHSGEVGTESREPGSLIPVVRMWAERGAALEDGAFEIRFRWEPGEMTFSEALDRLGHIPLPPYIERGDVPQDNDRYQTIYGHHEGSVAAPTAGLHFTQPMLDGMKERGFGFGYVTLHVGAGTFRPVKETDIALHVMHHERIGVSLRAIRELMENKTKGITAVGTTATRTLETLYWAGVKVLSDGAGRHPEVSQWDPYDERYDRDIPVDEALEALQAYLAGQGMTAYRSATQLMIVPGYRFRLTDTLLTNFHMPRSTLLMLVSAFAGDRWKDAYGYALSHGFRFLSYGDACLFLK